MAKRVISARLDAVENRLLSLRASIAAAVAESTAGTITTESFRVVLADLRHAREVMLAIPRTAAIAAKATEEWDYQGTIAEDFTAIENALGTLGNWLAARDTVMWNGYVIDDATWIEAVPVWSAANTAQFRTNANALIAAIDTFISRIR